MENLSVILVVVGLLSIACQYLAYRIKLPAILFLLLAGIIVGPGTNLINADELFGELLFPVVSLSVAIILFEGALTLKFSDISGHGKMVRNLCSIGVLVTWLVATPAAHFALGLSWELSALFGAIVTVTGPTVIVPMLRTVRPSTKIANILRWEGIVIDPIGALFAVLVFEFVLAQQNALLHTFQAFGITLLVGCGIGGLSGYLMGVALRRNWIPHYLQNTAVLTLMLAAFAFSNVFAHESGLLTVTIAGMILANMKNVNVDGILEFKETLSVLLISALFILLATRLDFGGVQAVGWGAVIVIAAIMFIARPLSVAVSSIGTGLSFREQALLAWIAPRGIVAAAVSALFSIKLEAAGYEEASLVVPMVFLVIIATVVIQSLTASTVAQWLGLRSPEQHGFLLFGAHHFSRELALELNKNDIQVILADTNWDAIRLARMQNIHTYFGNPMSDHAERHLDLSTIGSVLVISPYRQLNPLVTHHFEHELDKDATVLGLGTNESSVRESHQVSENYAQKLCLFGDGVTYAFLANAMKRGASIKTTRLSAEFTFADYQSEWGANAIPLVYIREGDVGVFTTRQSLSPQSGWKIISLILPEE
ncbi:sodium:proton antiporter [Alteromonas sp. ASW11-36]|uniref:Sodium:proton antiporter n=1 Tax=Alteromonas arenosi TaxID=3055817 RepID=A0ABT7T1G6_9ALTE|nr:sodium:proton antiporter [Alteromonas sp. ASW11-36]MDM7862272.1 sodium:proton antiporter [Alteromonas sp. ASW11-36]